MKKGLKKAAALCLIFLFLLADVRPVGASGEVFFPTGPMVVSGKVDAPCLMTGVKYYPLDPLRYDFIVDTGNMGLSGPSLKDESTKLIKFFLATLTTPEIDMWVNLSPHEKNRIIPEKFGLTQMGRDLLAQDYVLKQFSASLLHPDGEIGKKFWEKVYVRAYEAYGTAVVDIPTNTFSKVWIVPDTAVVAVRGRVAYLKQAHMKVMTETDYLATDKAAAEAQGSQEPAATEIAALDAISTQVMREVVIPEIERAVNEDAAFALLRQAYHSLVLAVWLKEKMKKDATAAENVKTWGEGYLDQNKVSGVDHGEKDAAVKIWTRYVDAFKQGVFNLIREDVDLYSGELIPRKYFSGGVNVTEVAGKIIEEPMGPGDVPANATVIAAKLLRVDKLNVAKEGDIDNATLVEESVSQHQFLYNNLIKPMRVMAEELEVMAGMIGLPGEPGDDTNVTSLIEKIRTMFKWEEKDGNAFSSFFGQSKLIKVLKALPSNTFSQGLTNTILKSGHKEDPELLKRGLVVTGGHFVERSGMSPKVVAYLKSLPELQMIAFDMNNGLTPLYMHLMNPKYAVFLPLEELRASLGSALARLYFSLQLLESLVGGDELTYGDLPNKEVYIDPFSLVADEARVLKGRAMIETGALEAIKEAKDKAVPTEKVGPIKKPQIEARQGGIDFNAKRLGIQEDLSNDPSPAFSFNTNMADAGDSQGYEPQILNIHAMEDVEAFLREEGTQ